MVYRIQSCMYLPYIWSCKHPIPHLLRGIGALILSYIQWRETSWDQRIQRTNSTFIPHFVSMLKKIKGVQRVIPKKGKIQWRNYMCGKETTTKWPCQANSSYIPKKEPMLQRDEYLDSILIGHLINDEYWAMSFLHF